MRLEFATATRIVFGRGVIREAPTIASQLGKKVFVVTGRTKERAARLLEGFQEAGLAYTTYSVVGEPTLDTVRKGASDAIENGCDVVVAFGGGAVIDTGKAIAMLMTNGGDPLEYIEVIGAGKGISRPSAPIIAIPTTAGTGSEVTRNAVLLCPEHRVKASIRSHFMLPTVALVDPELTRSMPSHITAYTGLDALTQLIEPYTSTRANPITDPLCREGMSRAARSLKRACEKPDDLESREDMAIASLFSGMALANAGLGAVHGFAAAIGGMFQAPHGAICARLLAPTVEMNARALQARLPDSQALRRYVEIAVILTGQETAGLADLVKWLHDICEELQIPSLSAFGVTNDHVTEIVDKAIASSSMKSNPVALTKEEMAEILLQAV